MKEQIAAVAHIKEAAFISGGVSAPIWMQTMNHYIGWLIGIFTLIYCILRIVNWNDERKYKWKHLKGEVDEFEEYKKEKDVKNGTNKKVRRL